MFEIASKLRRGDISKDILPFTVEEFETKFLLRQSVEKEGIVLYESNKNEEE